MIIERKIEHSAKMIWNCAVLQNQGANDYTTYIEDKKSKKIIQKNTKINGKLDDRPLYWARIKMQVALKRHYTFIKEVLTLPQPEQDKFFQKSIVPKDTKPYEIIQLFEEKSRNYTNIDFSKAGNTKKLLMLGFDPFGLDEHILQSNPSGVSILNLHNQIVGEYYIQCFVMPVRYKDFDEFKNGNGIIEEFVKPFIKTVDMIITISQTTPFRFNIDRFASKNRGGGSDNMNWGESINYNNKYFQQIQIKGDEFYETTLPYKKIVPDKNKSGIIFPIFFNQTFVTKSLKFTDESLQGTELLEDIYPNFNGLPELQSQVSVKGSGGSYLSNESFYRVARLRDELNPNLKTGHYHIPLIQSSASDKYYYTHTQQYPNANLIKLDLDNKYLNKIIEIVNSLIKKS